MAQSTSRINDISVDLSGLVSGENVDASQSIQAIINQLESDKVKKVNLPKSIYRLNNPIFIRSDDIEIDFSGSTLLNYAKGVDNQRGEEGIINIIGEMTGGDIVSYLNDPTNNAPDEAPTILTFENYVESFSEVNTIGSRITTSNNNYFEIGDEILINPMTRKEGAPYDVSLFQPYLRVIATIVDKDNNYLYTDYYSLFDYPAFTVGTGSPRPIAAKIKTIKNVTLKNYNIEEKVMLATENSATTAEWRAALSGVFVGLGDNIKCVNPRMERHKFSSIYPNFSRNITIENPYAGNPQWWIGGKGYLVQHIACRDIKVLHARGDGNRHLIDFSWSSNGYVEDSFQTNGKKEDFDLYGLCEHDITFVNCKGQLALGNGADLFPNICQNITIRNSKMMLKSATTGTDAYIRGLYVENSDILLPVSSLASDFVFKNSKIEWRYNRTRVIVNKRSQEFLAAGEFVDCELTLINSQPTDSTMRISLDGYDDIVFKNTKIKWGSDPNLFPAIPTLRFINTRRI